MHPTALCPSFQIGAHGYRSLSEAAPFPAAPLRTVREVLPHTALHQTFPASGAVAWKIGRPLKGWLAQRSTHPTDLFRLPDLAAGPSLGRGSVVPLPANGTMPGSDSLSLLLRASEEGLSSSAFDYPDIPRPLHRRVLDGCTSQFFTASVAFALQRGARLPLAPEGYANDAADFA